MMPGHNLPYQPADPQWQVSRHPQDAVNEDRVFGAPHQNYPITATTTNGTAAAHQQQLAPPPTSSSSQTRPASAAVMYSSLPHPGPSSSSQSPGSRKRASHSITTATNQPPPPLPNSTSSGIPAQPSSSTSNGTLTDVYSHPAALAYAAAHPKRKIPQFGPYLLLQTLGEGEFGKVKLGLHSEWGEEVAVKLIRRGIVDSSARMTKVEREIEVLRLIRHPNIVRLYDVIETDKFIGIVLEYASGGELFDHILAHRYLRERDASKLFAQLISGVWYCHKKKIVHRDLKLENLLLDRNRNVIITDFGFANHFEKKKDDLMQTSCGSPCYAAPELVISEGLYVGSAVDVWSCGVNLYAMLAGYLPFDDDPNNPDGDNINLLYKYIVSTPLTFPDYVSMEARDLLSIMLVPDPKYRATLEQVMAHSWLSAFQPLFKQSVRDLEHAAHAQQQEKRQQYQRQMRERAQQQNRPVNGANGPTTSPSRTRTTSGYPAAEQFFEDRDAAHTQLQQQPLYTASPTRARPVTTSVTLASPASIVEDPARNTNDFPYIPDYSSPGAASAPTHAAIGNPSGTPGADPRTRKESTRSRSGKQKATTPVLTSPGNTGTPSATAASTSPASPPRAGGPPSPSTEKKRRAAAGQRHTIQLEYGGDIASGTNQSTPRASGERTPVATAYPAASQPPTLQPSPIKPQGTRKATRPDSDGLDTIHYDPFTTEGIPRDLFREPDPAVVEALKRDEEERAAAAASASPKLSTPKSVGRAGGAAYRSPSTPTPVSPAVIAAVSSKGASPSIVVPPAASKKDVNASGSSLALSQQTRNSPPASVSRTGSTRHRRGMSMDKFGLGKLLGTSDQQQTPPPSAASATFAAQHQASQLVKAPSGGSTSSGHSKPPVTGGPHKKSGGTLPGLRNRLSGKLSRRQSGDVASVGSDKSKKEKEDNLHHILQQQQIQQKVEQDSGKKRRKTLSLMIDPMTKTLSKGMRRSTKPTETPISSVPPSYPSVLSPLPRPTPPLPKAPAPGPPRAPPSAFPTTLPSRTPTASTGKAKKVMDWFRKRSLVQEIENEDPTGASAPQVVVTDPTSTTRVAAPSGGSAPPSTWSGQRAVSSTAILQNSHGLLQPPGRSTSTREGSEARTPASTSPVSPAGAMRVHKGAVDPGAVTSGVLPDQVYARVLEVLRGMGVDISTETLYKAQCMRPKQRKDGTRQSGLAAFNITGLGGSSGTDRRGLPLPSNHSVTGFKGYLFRRGSSQATMPAPSRSQTSTGTQSLEANDFAPFTPTTPDPSISAHHSTDSIHASAPVVAEPIYGKRSEDKGGEVLFSVELTRMEGLPDMYHLDIRRVKGELKSYQFLYTKLRERCNFGGL